MATDLHGEADEALALIADYVYNTPIQSIEAYQTASASLADSLGCAILALNYPACTKLLGPIVPGTIVPHGCRIPGTSYVLDPVCGAFNLGTMIRWLDFNDTFLAAEWAHPSDNLGGILAVADYISQKNIAEGKEPLVMRDVLTAMIKAHEIQGGIAILNSFNRIGFDHVILVKVATAAVVTWLMGGNRDQILNSVSQAWIDVGPLRTYRHEPSAGSRKSWAAGEATSRGVLLSLFTMKGEMGYPQALSAPKWGLYDVLFKGQAFAFQQPLGSYVMENVLFKIAYPAEFHAQTAVEAALKLYPKVAKRLEDIESILITTHDAAMRIINKTGVLKNPADRDHCLQYMVAQALIHGKLTADYYEDAASKDPMIDRLRALMKVTENPQYSTDYHDPEKRSIANSITIQFKDGSRTETVAVEYPLGHRKRRIEGMPLLYQKCARNLITVLKSQQVETLMNLFHNQSILESMSVVTFLDHLLPPQA